LTIALVVSVIIVESEPLPGLWSALLVYVALFNFLSNYAGYSKFNLGVDSHCRYSASAKGHCPGPCKATPI
jgi:hypothetical protein